MFLLIVSYKLLIFVESYYHQSSEVRGRFSITMKTVTTKATKVDESLKWLTLGNLDFFVTVITYYYMNWKTHHCGLQPNIDRLLPLPLMTDNQLTISSTLVLHTNVTYIQLCLSIFKLHKHPILYYLRFF